MNVRVVGSPCLNVRVVAPDVRVVGSPCLNVRLSNDLGACLAASAHCNQSIVLLQDDEEPSGIPTDPEVSLGTPSPLRGGFLDSLGDETPLR